jgi:uncharacterized membrane protein (DUF106 family)
MRRILRKRRNPMDLSAYFTTLEYILMAATFVALILIFLYVYYGKEEEQETDKNLTASASYSTQRHMGYNA